MIRCFWLSLSPIATNRGSRTPGIQALQGRRVSGVLASLILTLLPCHTTYAEAESETLIFRESSEFAPYIYRHGNASGKPSGAPQGYIPALLKYFADDHGITIDYREMPTNRLESAYEKGQLDAAILSDKWILNADNFIFSQPLGVYRTVIYTSDMPQRDLVPLVDLKSQYVCAQRGYRYPNLDLLWASNNLIRVDFADEKLQLEGLIANRCQYAVMDEAVGRWYGKKMFKQHSFSIVSEESQVPLTLGFRKDKTHYAELFDSTISRLKANGELSILQRVFGVIGK